MVDVLWSFLAMICLTPLLVAPWRAVLAGEGQDARADAGFWHVLALASLAAIIWAGAQMAGHWRGSLSHTLWVSNAACLVIFAGLCAVNRQAWRLSVLFAPYVVWVGLVATAFAGFPGREMLGGAPNVWIDLHIAVSVTTYALLTLAAIASLAAFWQQRALKTKRINRLTRFLPPVVESDRLQFHLLAACELVLGAGILSGMAVSQFERGILLRLDHKTLLSLATFVIIGALLFAHSRSGLRGKTAARVALIAYLLLTLGYPGVKFVSGVLLN